MEKRASPETKKPLLNLKKISNELIPWDIRKRSIICDKLDAYFSRNLQKSFKAFQPIYRL